MTDEDVLRRVVEHAGGLGARPERKMIEIRRPQFFSMPGPRPVTVYIPQLPPPLLNLPEDAPDTPIHIDALSFMAAEHQSSVWVTIDSCLNISDPLHPVLYVYGYWRHYIMRVWMPSDEFYKRFPPEEEVPGEEEA